MLCSVVVNVATAAEVVRLFYACADSYGLPQSVLTDNGAIYTTAYRGSHSGMEIELAILGIRYKHGKPYRPPDPGQGRALPPNIKEMVTAPASLNDD